MPPLGSEAEIWPHSSWLQQVKQVVPRVWLHPTPRNSSGSFPLSPSFAFRNLTLHLFCGLSSSAACPTEFHTALLSKNGLEPVGWTGGRQGAGLLSWVSYLCPDGRHGVHTASGDSTVALLELTLARAEHWSRGHLLFKLGGLCCISKDISRPASKHISNSSRLEDRRANCPPTCTGLASLHRGGLAQRELGEGPLDTLEGEHGLQTHLQLHWCECASKAISGVPAGPEVGLWWRGSTAGLSVRGFELEAAWGRTMFKKPGDSLDAKMLLSVAVSLDPAPPEAGAQALEVFEIYCTASK